MKPYLLLAAVLALSSACSSSASDRPSTNDERQAAIQRDRDNHEHANREHPGADSTQEMPDSDARNQDEDRDRTAGDSHATKDEPVTKHEPDNTGRNARDDEPGNLTALDQSNKSSDVDITQAIRKKVVADDALSFNAKNVKIITVSGKVTLRGPVASAQESAAIEKSARTVSGVVQVDNQIEVKP